VYGVLLADASITQIPNSRLLPDYNENVWLRDFPYTEPLLKIDVRPPPIWALAITRVSMTPLVVWFFHPTPKQSPVTDPTVPKLFRQQSATIGQQS